MTGSSSEIEICHSKLITNAYKLERLSTTSSINFSRLKVSFVRAKIHSTLIQFDPKLISISFAPIYQKNYDYVLSNLFATIWDQ